MTVARDDTARIQGGPEVVLNGLVAKVVADGLLHFSEPVQDFLVSQSMERTSKTIQTSGKREHRRAESGANQVSGVCRNVTALLMIYQYEFIRRLLQESTDMISVDNEVQPHQINEILVSAET